MAKRVAQADAVINLSVKGTSQAIGELKPVGKLIEQIQDESNVDFKIGLNNKNDAAQINKIVEKYKGDVNSYTLDESFSKYIEQLVGGDKKTEAKQLQEIINKGINSLRSTESSSGFDSFNEDLKKQQEIIENNTKLISDYKKQIEDLNSKKNNSANFDKEIKNKQIELNKLNEIKQFGNDYIFRIEDEFKSAYNTYIKDPESKDKQSVALAKRKILDKMYMDNAKEDGDSSYEEIYKDFLNQKFSRNKRFSDVFDDLDDSYDDSDTDFVNKVKELYKSEQQKIDSQLKEYDNALENIKKVNKEIKTLKEEKNKANSQEIDNQIADLQQKINEAERLKSQAENIIKEIQNGANTVSNKEVSNPPSSSNKDDSGGNGGNGNAEINDLLNGKGGTVPVNIKVANMDEFVQQIESKEYNLKINPSNLSDFSNKIEENINIQNKNTGQNNNFEVNSNNQNAPKRMSENEIKNKIYSLFSDSLSTIHNNFGSKSEGNLFYKRYQGDLPKIEDGGATEYALKTAYSEFKKASKSNDLFDIEEKKNKLIAILTTYKDIDATVSNLTKNEQAFLNESGVLDIAKSSQNVYKETSDAISENIKEIGSLTGKLNNTGSVNSVGLDNFKDLLLNQSSGKAVKYFKDTFRINLNEIRDQISQADNIVNQGVNTIEQNDIKIPVDIDIEDFKKRYEELLDTYKGLSGSKPSEIASDIYNNAKTTGDFSSEDLAKLLALSNKLRNDNIEWENRPNNKNPKSKDEIENNLFDYKLKDAGLDKSNVATILSDVANKCGIEFVNSAVKTQKEENNKTIDTRKDSNTNNANNDKQIYEDINKRAEKYGKLDANSIYDEIKGILKQSVESGKALTVDQNKELLAATNAYNVRKYGNISDKNHSVLAEILKGDFGIQDFDSVFGGNRKGLKESYKRYLSKLGDDVYAEEQEVLEKEAQEREDKRNGVLSSKKTSRKKTIKEDEEPTDEDLVKIENRKRIQESLDRAKKRGLKTTKGGSDDNPKVTYDVELNVSNEQVSSLKNSIKSGVNPIEIEIKPEESAFNATQQKINQVFSDIEAQKEKISKTNNDIQLLPENYNGSAYTEKNFKKGTTEVSLNKIKSGIKDYNSAEKTGDAASIAEAQDNLVAMLATYKNLDNAASAFGEKQKTLFDNIKSRIETAKESQQQLDNIKNSENIDNKEIDKKMNEIPKEVSITLTTNPTIETIQNDINSINDKDISLNINKNPSIESINSEINSLDGKNVNINIKTTPEINTIQNKINDINKVDPVDVKINPIVSSGKGLKDIDKTIEKLAPSTLSTMSNAFNNVSQDISSYSDQMVNSINSVKTALTELKESLKGINLTKVSDFEKYENKIKKLQESNEKLKTNSSSDKENIKSLKQQITSLNSENKKLKKDSDSKIKQANSEAKKNLKQAQSESDSKIKQVQQEADNKVKEANNKVKKAEEKVKKAQTDAKNAVENYKKEISQKKSSTKPTANQLKDSKENFISAAKKSNLNIDNDSVKIDSKGIITFTRYVQDLGDSFETVSYKMNSFNKDLKSDDKIDTRWLNKNATVQNVGKKEKDSADLYISFEEYAKKSGLNYKNLDVSGGNIRFDQVVKNADGSLQTFTRVIENISDVLNKNGTIKKSFLKTSGLVSNEKESKFNNDISSQKKDLIDSILNQKTFDTVTVHPKMSEDEINKQSKENAIDVQNKEILLQNTLNEAVKQGVITEQRRLDIIENINEVKSKELNLKTPENRTSSQEDFVKNSQNKYNEMFGGLSDTDISNKYVDAAEIVDGKVVQVKENIIKLKEQIKQLNDSLSNGVFENNDDIKRVQSLIADTYNQISAYDKKYKVSDGVFGSIDTGKTAFSNLSSDDKVASIRKGLEAIYGKRGLKVGNYVDGIGSNVEFVDDSGIIMKGTVKVEEYTKAIQENTDAKNKNAQASSNVSDNLELENAASLKFSKLNSTNKIYQTSGEKWFSGLKSKINNLTQYVTGIGVVMRAWSEVQQGFSFIKDFDASLTTINETMNTTQTQLSNLGKGAIDAGKNLGSAADSVLDAAAIYANANETAESVLEKSKPTVLLSNASGLDTSTSANQIQAVTHQFEDLEGQETRVVNSYEKISANLGIDFAKGINMMSEAVQTSGSVAEQAGMQFETYAASVGKISEMTRQEGKM